MLRPNLSLPLAALFAGCALAGAAHADIAVGLAAPLTGAFQSLGEQVRNGAEVAAADINATGGVLGEKLSLEERDDACDPRQAVIAAGDLIASHVVAVIGHVCSGAAIAAAPAYVTAGIVEISPSATAAAYTDERAGPGVFRVSARDDAQGTVAGNYLAHNFAGKKVAFLDDKTAGGRAIASAALAAFDAAGEKEALATSYDAGTRTYTSLASVLQAADVDAVFVGGNATDVAAIAHTLKDKGMTVAIFGDDALASEDFYRAAGDASDGVMMTALSDPRLDPDNALLVAEFRQRQIEPAGYTLYAYAALQVWAAAATAAKSTDYGKVSAAIASGSFKTALGTLSFDGKGDVKPPAYTVYVWRKGDYAPAP
jgi:branched-chain amino acid transport system substrate-binding protein